MIATLSGKTSHVLADSIILEVNGIGYEVRLTAPDFVKATVGQNLKLFIYQHLREDASDLYGFVQPETKLLFEQLISVSGVGPKMGLTILSAVSADDVRSAIATENGEILRGVSGVGDRTAARIIVELRNKVMGGARLLSSQFRGNVVYEALRQLGYSAQTAQAATAAVPPDIKTDEERIKLALKEAAK